jgi:hypothetical protein
VHSARKLCPLVSTTKQVFRLQKWAQIQAYYDRKVEGLETLKTQS